MARRCFSGGGGANEGLRETAGVDALEGLSKTTSDPTATVFRAKIGMRIKEFKITMAVLQALGKLSKKK